ncbi:MAG: hypothetical protein M5U07_24510 [Xanthobacteraceae bacterium]|nr:hypothetical protein [Xanthobacteraceae bacterium]
MSLEYPADLFAIEPPPPDNAGRSFAAPAAKARFSVHSHANAFGASLDELMAEDVLQIGDDQPQRIVRADGYAVIGARDGEMIVRRVLLSEGGAFVHRLEIAYPLADAKRFEAIMGRMIGSFTVDPSLPAKAAAAAERAAPAGEPRWQAIETIGLGLRPRGTRQRAGLSFEIPADWRRVRLPESYLLEYEGFTDKGAKLRLLVEAFASPANVALAREAAAIKSVIRAGVEDYREGNEADLTAALRPARRLTLTFVAMDSPEAQRQEYLLVRAGGTVFKILVDGPAAEGATIRRVFDRVAQTLGVAE